MTPAEHRRVRDLFEAALDEPPSSRMAWVDRESFDAPAIAAEVRSLLEHDACAGEFLELPILDAVPSLLGNERLAVGAKVGSYVIVREIGRGGMGIVYLASDERLGRTIALKALGSKLTTDARQRERFRDEARAAAGLTHPGICTVYALEEIDGELYIATEFVDGATLRDEMRSHRPSSDDVLRAARELASALAAAHDRGITHRDLKPENIMRTSDGRLKIVDFGLARTESPVPLAVGVTAPGVMLGTPGYMAPEQLKGQAVDRRADVFALGVLLYEYASGSHPFEADGPLALMARTLESEAPSLGNTRTDLPPAFVAVIERCLRKTPSARFQSATEMVGALDLVDLVSSRPAGVTTWWRVHQVVAMALYFGAAALGWQLKEWRDGSLTIMVFMILGIGATIGCVLRGHMIFTERVNPASLVIERRRTSRAMLVVDIVLGVALSLDAAVFVARPLTSVPTLGLALGIVLAATLVERATVRAAFADDSQ